MKFLFLVLFLAVALAQPKPNPGAPTGTGPKPYVSKNPWGGLSKLQRMPGNNKGWAIKNVTPKFQNKLADVKAQVNNQFKTVSFASLKVPDFCCANAAKLKATGIRFQVDCDQGGVARTGLSTGAATRHYTQTSCVDRTMPYSKNCVAWRAASGTPLFGTCTFNAGASAMCPGNPRWGAQGLAGVAAHKALHGKSLGDLCAGLNAIPESEIAAMIKADSLMIKAVENTKLLKVSEKKAVRRQQKRRQQVAEEKADKADEFLTA